MERFKKIMVFVVLPALWLIDALIFFRVIN